MRKRLYKKGASQVVSTLLLVALTIILVGVAWTIVNNLVQKGTESSADCFEIFDKVSLNSAYTCYTYEGFRFSINIENIDVEEVLVGISAGGESASFRISENPSQIDNLVMYPTGSSEIILPSKNSGLSYVFNMEGAGLSIIPDLISIAPVIGGSQCDISDSMGEIVQCST